MASSYHAGHKYGYLAFYGIFVLNVLTFGSPMKWLKTKMFKTVAHIDSSSSVTLYIETTTATSTTTIIWLLLLFLVLNNIIKITKLKLVL